MNRLLLLAGLAAAVPLAAAQHAAGPHRPDGAAIAPRVGEVRGPQGGVSVTPTVTFDTAGRLWTAWFEASHVFVSWSRDRGRTFETAVRVTRAPEDVDANGESRPKIAVAPSGDVFTTWTRKGARPFTGDIRFARSIDGGRTFDEPRTLNDDGLQTGHRFDALHLGPGGAIYVAWIDKRDLEKAAAGGGRYDGAALYYAQSTDRGASFGANRKLNDHVCECCRLAVDFDGEAPVLVWRDIFDGTTRDHAIMRFADAVTPGVPARATHDGWKIDACPHHGPSLSISSDGVYHLAWFTGHGPAGPGAFYARSSDRGRTFTAPLRVGSVETFGHASVLSRGPVVYLAWKEAVAPRGMSIHVARSGDGGRTWSPATEALRTNGASDHPFLVAGQNRIYLSWFTGDEGLRLVDLEAEGTVTMRRREELPSPGRHHPAR